MTRRQARIQALQLLYSREINPEAEGSVLPDQESSGHDEYAQKIITAVDQNQTAIDALINRYSKNWNTAQMNKVDLVLLRMAIAESKYIKDEELTPAIIINEALDLTRQYSTDEAVRFVNGVLDAAMKDS
ncbi:MAG: transcription antitermination factor NusB [Negativicoccus succinicivorans]|uniref:transcription antitermination factor NusB n=1 Tax=Negativicoccus succinicivorans TaxID=620903 RepID=UPI000763D752|nr:transcription antitermination factor NusB [Negativicoccus succinicivorans]KWZ82569.1 transcription antitermination factor NusB [Anaerococcus hydrogenalis]MDU5396297.1 transcription antitermination factor NusB [Negativicoccus succinicivorans]MDU5914703.1 transcription antitermination factor NusB [Negativicoccus succinicivorans]